MLCRKMDMRLKASLEGNWTEEERRQRLEQLSYDTFYILLPTVIFVVLMLLIGVPGNLLVIFVYFKQFPPSATRVFVLALAVCDLVINAYGMPRHILLMRYSYCSQGLIYCRMVGPLAVFPILLSYWLLVCVALERRDRICNPLGRHLDPSHATASLVIPIALTALVIFPFLELQEEASFDIGMPELKGVHCTFPTISGGINISKVYTVFLMSSFAVILMLLVICYGNILLVVLRQRDHMGRYTVSHSIERTLQDVSIVDSRPAGTRRETDSTALKCTVPDTAATEAESLQITTRRKESNDSAKELNDSAKESNDSAKEPKDSAKEPNNSAKEPKDSAKNPNNSAKEPKDSAKEPNDSAKEPNDSAKEFCEPEERNDTESGENSQKDPTLPASDNTNNNFSQVEDQPLPSFVITEAEESPSSSIKIQTDQTHEGQPSSGTATLATSSLHEKEGSFSDESSCPQRRIESERRTQPVRRQDKRVFSKTTLMMLVLTGTTIICCLPYFYAQLAQVRLVGQGIGPISQNIRFLVRVFPSMNSVINPFIYNFFNPRFRAESYRFITKMKRYLFPDF